jgi:hypothetical protein
MHTRQNDSKFQRCYSIGSSHQTGQNIASKRKPISNCGTQAAKNNSTKFLRAWFYVPLGITVMLAACFGIDSLFHKFNVAFPASVTCMMLLFLALIASESSLGTHKTRELINIIDVPVSQWQSHFTTHAALMSLGWLVTSMDGCLLYAIIRPPTSKSAHRNCRGHDYNCNFQYVWNMTKCSIHV